MEIEFKSKTIKGSIKQIKSALSVLQFFPELGPFLVNHFFIIIIFTEVIFIVVILEKSQSYNVSFSKA